MTHLKSKELLSYWIHKRKINDTFARYIYIILHYHLQNLYIYNITLPFTKLLSPR